MKLHLLAVFAALICLGCKDDPVISGKSANVWLDRLNDLDPKVQSEAIQALDKAPVEYTEAAKSRLLEIASKRIWVSTEAAILLANKQVEVRPEFASLYLRPKYITHGILDDGATAIMMLHLDHPKEAEAEVRRRLAESTDKEDVRLLNYVLASMLSPVELETPEVAPTKDFKGPQDNRGHSDE